MRASGFILFVLSAAIDREDTCLCILGKSKCAEHKILLMQPYHNSLNGRLTNLYRRE